ncbi:MAG: hypothetical protein LBN24_03600 [Mediterranea sp.]|nr:hypothetical protein [Mediterranea sp.]
METKGEYSDIDKKSAVNPDNRMGLEQFASLSQLYPILGFKSSGERLQVKLQAEANIQNYNFAKDSTRFSFQELYSQFEWQGKHFFVFGKKRLDWGTGMIWNPTNFFIQKDPVRTQNRLEGIFMLNYTLLFGRNTVSAYLFPEKKGKETKGALRYEYSQGRVDASLSLVEYGRFQQIGYDFSYGGDLFTAYSEGVLKNYTRLPSLNGDGSFVEAWQRRKRFRAECVLGAVVLFNSHWSFSGEYRYREDAMSRKESKLYMHGTPIRLELFDPLTMGRHSLFGSLEYKETYSRWSVSLRSFYDASTNQLTLSPLGVISLNNFQIELNGMFYNNALSVHNLQASLLVSCFF